MLTRFLDSGSRRLLVCDSKNLDILGALDQDLILLAGHTRTGYLDKTEDEVRVSSGVPDRICISGIVALARLR